MSSEGGQSELLRAEGNGAVFDARARTAVHPHGPGNGAAPLVRQGAHRERRSTEPEHGHHGERREGESDEKKYTAKFQKTPSPSPARARPEEEPDGGQPPCLGESPAQERTQRHTVEHIIETFVPVPMLDVLVPLMVVEPVDVLKIRGISSLVAQVIDVPKIISQDNIPQRAVLRVPRLVEQLVDVPVAVMTVQRRCRPYVVPGRGADRGLLVDVGHTTRPADPGLTASPGQRTNTGQGWWCALTDSGCGRPCDHAAQVPAVLADRERGGASDSVHRQIGDIPGVTQKLVRTVAGYTLVAPLHPCPKQQQQHPLTPSWVQVRVVSAPQIMEVWR